MPPDEQLELEDDCTPGIAVDYPPDLAVVDVEEKLWSNGMVDIMSTRHRASEP